MKAKQTLSALFCALLIALTIFPCLAVSAERRHEQAPIGLTTEIITQGDQPGLYVTLKNVPPELWMVCVKYSFNGVDYAEYDGKAWKDIDKLVDETGSLTLLCYGAEEHPLAGYLSEAVNNLYIKVTYDTEDYAGGGELEPIRFSHNKTYEVPQTSPPFSADLELGWFSYSVIGHYTDFAPNVARVRTAYSWDGLTYQYSNPEWPSQWDLKDLGNGDASARNRLENQEIALYYEEPMVSFLAYKQDSFYLRLEITTEDNETYYSQPAYVSRAAPQLLPENLTPRISLGFDAAVQESRNDKGLSEDDEDYYAQLVNYTFGEIQLTVRDDATWEELRSYLPDTVPVRIRFWDKGSKTKIAYGDLSCKVNWKEPPSFSFKQGESLVIEDMAEPLVIPAGTEVVTALGTYILRKPLTFQSRYDSDDIRLILNPVTAQDQPNAVLRGDNRGLVDGDDGWNDSGAEDPLSLAFWNKPSGATSIKAYACVDNVRTLLGDLLDRRNINHNQSHALYGYIDLLRADEYPYQDYLSGDIDSFTIELSIEGGVYDGKQTALSWPQTYELPEEIFDPFGSEGQENNAGAGYEEIAEESDGNGGQRPGLPVEKEPPVDIPPMVNPVPKPEPTVPSVPSLKPQTPNPSEEAPDIPVIQPGPPKESGLPEEPEPVLLKPSPEAVDRTPPETSKIPWGAAAVLAGGAAAAAAIGGLIASLRKRSLKKH